MKCEKCDGKGEILKEYTDEEFEDYLDEIYGEVEICGYKYSAGRALKEIDEIAFNCAKSEAETEEDCPDCDGTGEIDDPIEVEE